MAFAEGSPRTAVLQICTMHNCPERHDTVAKIGGLFSMAQSKVKKLVTRDDGGGGGGSAAGPRYYGFSVRIEVTLLKALDGGVRRVVHSDTSGMHTNVHEKTGVNTTWNSYLEFSESITPEDTLSFTLVHVDHNPATKNERLGAGSVVVAKLMSGEMTTIPISLEHKIASRASAPCDLTVRLLDMTKPHAQSKVVFLVRHGESKWNAAQKSRDFLGLMSHDHPLNEMGLQQALELNARWKQPPDADNEYITNARSAELHKLFLAITHAYSSPLTRAVQTACGVLEGHVSLKEGRHLTLLSGIREIRSSIGSLDTSGSAVGAEIAGRVKSELEGLTGKARAAQLVPLIDPNDADSTYWSHLKDSKDRVRLRQDALLRLIRFSEWESAVFGGHSLFWRTFFRAFADTARIAVANPNCASQMGKQKMGNGSMMAVRIEWAGNGTPSIVEARMLYGTTFAAGDVDTDTDDDEDDGGADAGPPRPRRSTDGLWGRS